MASTFVCEGTLAIPATPARLPTCEPEWTVITYVEPTEFQDLVALLQFDPEIFAILFGTSVLMFVVGHFAGHVARNLARK